MNITNYMTGAIEANTYLVYDETKKGFIVDPGGYSKELSNQIKDEGIDVLYIILTHGHADHIGGVDLFKKELPNAKVVAYIDEKPMLKNEVMNCSMEICGRPISLDADIYVKDRETLTVGNIELTFIHTPGHTPGGMSIMTKGIVFSGDTLFRASIGRTDFPGGSFEDIIKSIKERLFILPDNTRVLTGHMGETTIGFEKEHNPFV